MIGEPPDCPALKHEAMATEFAARVAHPDRGYARQAVAAAFNELDRLEKILSRFVEGSDIHRISRIGPGGVTRVQPETFECLRIALEVQRATDGAFDVTYGSAECGERFELDPERCAVRVLADDVKLDLGGIGKGFALDRMAAVLGEWEIESALLCASDSTVLAIGERSWRIEIASGMKRELRRAAISASGRGVKGDHIVDPRTRRAATSWWRCWSAATTGSAADALSTAFMIMTEQQIRAYCANHPEVSAYAQPNESGEVIVIADRIEQLT
jgi:thiamine biosynthesis lipoprotein